MGVYRNSGSSSTWSELRICDVGGKRGFFLPFTEREAELSNGVRATIHATFMVYCFLGVSIAADIFMSSIEAITGRRGQKMRRNGKLQTYKVWNATIANLSLMALGSSAPEIFLSVIDTVRNEFHAGELGPSTIVGSAAFNLFVIVAVCMLAIPNGDGRCVEQVAVFVLTAAFSLLAYLWLVVIVSVWSPDVVTILEASLTFAYLPLLLYLSWRVDMFGMAGLIPFHHVLCRRRNQDVAGGTADAAGAEPPALVPLAKSHSFARKSVTMDGHAVMIDGCSSSPLRKADAKHEFMRMICAGRGVTRSFSRMDHKFSVASTGSNVSSRASGRSPKAPVVQFMADFQMMCRNKDAKQMCICRYGDFSQEIRVEYSVFQLTFPLTTPLLVRTMPDVMREWCAMLPHGERVPEFDGDGPLKGRPKHLVMRFEAKLMPGEDQKEILVPKPDVLVPKSSENSASCKDFIVQLTDAKAVSDSVPVNFGPLEYCAVKVSPPFSPGKIKFPCEKIFVKGSDTTCTFEVIVLRMDGCNGPITCNFRCEPLSALEDYHYTPADGVIDFPDGVTEARIELTVLPILCHRHPKEFVVILDDPDGEAEFEPSDDGGAEAAILTVCIETPADKSFWRWLDRFVNLDSIHMGNADWYERAAGVLFVGGCLEEQRKAGCIEWVFHFVALPWKIIFIVVPPVHYFGGWVCFVASLLCIAFLTGLIADLADLFGCVLDIPDMVTAITFVALGTSMPDLFASKGAAMQDPTADASIVNVTGSNSVNVFLGLGVPWTMASVFWAFQERTPQWEDRYRTVSGRIQGIAFVVEGKELGFNVLAFSGCCVVGLVIIALKRHITGVELGGPAGVKFSVAFLYLCLWFAYILLASWRALRPGASSREELEIVLIVAGVLLVITLIALGFLLREHIRNLSAPPKEDQPDEEDEKVSVLSSDRDKASPRETVDYCCDSQETKPNGTKEADDRPGEECQDIKPPLVAQEAPSGTRGRYFSKH